MLEINLVRNLIVQGVSEPIKHRIASLASSGARRRFDSANAPAFVICVSRLCNRGALVFFMLERGGKEVRLGVGTIRIYE